MRIILASASPRRQEILRGAGFDFDIITSDVDEDIPYSKPDELPYKLSKLKAETVFLNVAGDCIVIGADTVVSVDGEVLGKPKDHDDYVRMMNLISGRTHQVYTGVTILMRDDDNMYEDTFAIRTDVLVSKLTDREIEEYYDSGEPMDKAGGYGIQGGFAKHVVGIEGDYYNVVGLPINSLYEKLKKLKNSNPT